MSNTKIGPVGAELFHAYWRTERRTDVHDEANTRFFTIVRTRLRMSNTEMNFQKAHILGDAIRMIPVLN
jgi:hypothetical protein